jgi:hypothetical protein
MNKIFREISVTKKQNLKNIPKNFTVQKDSAHVHIGLFG